MPRRSPTRPPLPRGRLGSRLLRGAPAAAPTAVTLTDSATAADRLQVAADVGVTDQGQATDRIRVPPARFLTIAVSGLEFTPVVNEASTTQFSNLEFQVYDSDYHTESQASLNYLAGRGWPALKIPFRPERVTPVLSGAANATELGRLTTSLDRAATAGKLGILDRHSYGVYYRDGSETGQTAGTGFRQAIGSANYPTAAFVDSWVRIITALGSHTALWGICLENEPQGTGGLTRATWYAAAQQAVTALRNLGWAGWIQVNGWNWGDLFHWTTQNPSGPWISDPLNKTIYDGHHYFSEFDDGTYPSPYATVVADAVTRGFTAGANPDALYTRLFTDLDLFADWGDTYGVPLVIGECNVPNDQDTSQWNALLAAYLARARSRGIGVQAWSAGEFYTPGGDKLSIYAKTTSGTPLSVQEEQAPTWEAALTDETPKTLADSGAAADQLTPAAQVTLTQTATAVDTTAAAASVTVGDQGVAADTLQVATPPQAKTLTDSGAAVERLCHDGGPAGAPDCILDRVNLTGPLPYLWDDPTTPDADWLTAVDPTLPTDLRVSFPTPATAPGAGGPTDLQVLVRKNGTGPDPTVAVDLWEHGRFIRELINATVSSPIGQLVTGTFDPAELTDPTGAGVEGRVRFGDPYGSGYGEGY